MSKMLVTGASGFLGRRVVAFYKDTYEVIAPSHKAMDITDEEAVNSVFQIDRPDIVIHCAAESNVGACEKNPEVSQKQNILGAENIVRAGRKVGAKCILFSSDQVYFGSRLEEAHKEEEPLIPGNHYGRQKQYAEQSCLSIDPDSVHLRLSWMYDINSFFTKDHKDFTSDFLEKFTQNQPFIYPIHDKRGITDVWEVVKNLEKAKSLPGGIYHFGSPNERNTYETVKKLCEMLKLSKVQVQADLTSYCEAPRNLTMSQERINRYGITFPDTIERLYDTMMTIRKDSGILKEGIITW